MTRTLVSGLIKIETTLQVGSLIGYSPVRHPLWCQ